MIYCRVKKLVSQKQFFIAFVYGCNSRTLRGHLWEDIENISLIITAPWSVIGDFNLILHPNKRLEGNEVKEGDIRDFTRCLQRCELHEKKGIGAFLS